MDLKDQVALVTGAASGIGRAAARMLAERGAVVTIADINGEGAEREAAELVQGGHRAESRTVDVGDREAVDGLVAGIVSSHGRLDTVVHCAAIARVTDLLDVSDEEWRAVLRVDLDGSFWLGRAAGRVMAKQKSGTMVFLTSDRGTLGAPQVVHYAASKGGVIALVKSLALALGPSGVTVNAINPGATDTGHMTEELRRSRMATDPLGEVSRPEQIAETVAFLCGPARTFMTGQIVTTRIR